MQSSFSGQEDSKWPDRLKVFLILEGLITIDQLFLRKYFPSLSTKLEPICQGHLIAADIVIFQIDPESVSEIQRPI
jgi:hypothetical protein